MASTKDYFSNETIVALTTSFVPQYFGFHAKAIAIYNDSTTPTDYLEWSFSGETTGGRLYGGEQLILDHSSNGFACLSLRSTPAAVAYRLEVVGV